MVEKIANSAIIWWYIQNRKERFSIHYLFFEAYSKSTFRIHLFHHKVRYCFFFFFIFYLKGNQQLSTRSSLHQYPQPILFFPGKDYRRKLFFSYFFIFFPRTKTFLAVIRLDVNTHNRFNIFHNVFDDEL